MAKLYKRYRKNGAYTWYVNFMQQGRFRMKSTGTSDKRLAQEMMRRIEEKEIRIKKGLEPTEEIKPVLLSEFTALYLEDRRRLAKAHRTITTDEYALKRLKNYTGDCALISINEITVRRYRDHLLKQIKPTSVAIEFRHLKAAFSWAAEQVGTRYIYRNPFRQKGLIPSSPKSSKPLCLSPEEKQRFLDVIDEDRYKHLFKFFLLTGCRRSEAVRLEWEDIELTNNKIIFRKTKSGKDRVVYIGLELMQTLKALNRSQLKPFPYHPDWITHLFKRYLRAVGIEKDFHLHCLRHTAASDLARKGFPLTHIKEFLGHSSIKVTEIYTHALPEEMRNMAESLTCLG